MDEPRPAAQTPEFARVCGAVRALVFRPDFIVQEIPAPASLAPEAFALAGDVRPAPDTNVSMYGTGRIVLLHDPDEPEAWGAPWRIVAFAQAPLEPELATDPLLADVAWSWLVDALDAHGAAFDAASGTVTKILSRGFGSLADDGDGAQTELRASWSPTGPIAPHIDAWAELVCMLAGLPPGSEDIAVIGGQRLSRG